jgi:hypothetical protein
MPELNLPPNAHVVWEPIPGTSQELALDSRAHHTLYTGTRGPGKSDTQLMRFRRRVGIGYGEFWRGVIFDREYKHLDDLVSKSKRWFYRFNDGAEFKESAKDYKWVWPTGEELLFRQFKTKEDYQNYHGQEYPFIGWNELTKYPTSEPYEMMMSCNRSSFTPEKDSPRDAKGKISKLMPPIPLEVFATTNSTGPGHGWTKRRFIDIAPYGQIVKREHTVFNPRTQKEETIIRTQVAIFGSYKENIYLDPAYIAGLMEMCEKNPALRKAWLEGDWNVVAGGAFDDVWDDSIHVIPMCTVPPSWYIDRTFDWGSSHPFSVGWWAEANGEEMKFPDGRIFCPPAGTLIQIGEWYGTREIGTNKGLKLPAGEIAEGIRKQEIAYMAAGHMPSQPWPGPADNQIRDVRESDVDTIEKKMSDKGICWTQSDKSPGSRKIGLELTRERLINAKKKEGKAIYFMDNCRATIAILPILPRDEEKEDDIDTEAEDHPWDMIRYRVLKGNNRLATKIHVKYPN